MTRFHVLKGASPPPRRVRRPRLRRIVFALFSVIFLLTAGLATLPWWIPIEWTRTRIESALCVATGGSVVIGALTLTWADGFILRDLRIRPRGEPLDLLSVRELRAELDPWRIVTGRAMRRVTLTAPEIRLVVDASGRLNASRLDTATPGSWPPAEEIAIRGARLTLDDARTRTVAELELGDIALKLDRDSGRAEARVRGTPIRTLRTHATVTTTGAIEAVAGLHVPALRAALAPKAARRSLEAPNAPELSGEGMFRWTDVDLASLPLKLVPGLSGLDMRGQSSGEIAASIGPMLDQSLALRAEVTGLTLLRDGEVVVENLPWCRLQSAGVWKPAYDVLELSQLSYEMPGAEIKGRPVASGGPVFAWSLGGETIVQVALTGRLADIRQLRALLPSRLAARLLGAVGDDEAGGQIHFEAAVATGRAGSSLELAIGSDGLRLARGSPLQLRTAKPIETRLRAHQSAPSGMIRIDELMMTLGGIRVSGHGTLPGSFARRDSIFTEAAFSASIADLEELASLLPSHRLAARSWRAGGPARMDFRLDGADTGGGCQFTVAIDGSGEIHVPGVFHKPGGSPLVVEGAARWDAAHARRLKSLRLAAQSGAAVIELRGDTAGGEGAPLSWDLRSATAPDKTAAGQSGVGAITLDASLHATLSINGVEHWLKMLPAVAELGRHVDVRGDAAVAVTAHLRHSAAHGNVWPELYRISAEGEGTDLELETPSGIRKSSGEPARWVVDYRFDRSRPRDAHRLSCRAELPSATLSGSASLGGGRALVQIEGDVHDMAALAESVTPAAGGPGPRELSGSAAFRAVWLETPEFGRRDFRIDFTNTAISTGEGDGSDLRKQRGTPMHLEAAFRVARPLVVTAASDDSGLVRWDVEQIRFMMGGLSVGVPRGHLLFEPKLEHRWLNEIAAGRLPTLRTDPERWKCEFDVEGSLIAGDGQPAILPHLGIAEFQGRATVDARCAASPDGLILRGRLDATAAHIRMIGGAIKPTGMTAVVSMDAEMNPSDRSGGPPASLKLLLHDTSLQLADGCCRAAGRIRWPLGAPTLGDPAIEYARIEIDSGDLSGIEPLLRHGGSGALRALSVPSGRARARITFDRRDNGLLGQQGSITFDRASFQYSPWNRAPLPIELDGRLEIDDRAMRFYGLNGRLGASRFSIGGDLRIAAAGLDGNLVLASPRLDARELLALADEWGKSTDAHAGLAGRERTINMLCASNLRLTAHATHAEFPGFSSQTDFPVDELSIDATIQRGRVTATFACAANDGTVNGTWRTDLSKNDPTFDLAYTARNLTASPNTRPIVEAFFPGMLVKGRLTLIDESHQRLFALPGRPNFPTGKGEMILEDGQVVGRAAPVWVTSVFPRLNLAEFNYSHMINRFEKLDDGTHLNDMTFFGSVYHVYATGYTRADGDARYEVGVDLLARLSPDLSRIGQGRIALFNKTGRIRDGRFENEVVSYLDPLTVTRKIFSNNVLTIAYHAIRRQVIGPTASDGRSSPSSVATDGGAAD